MQDYIIGTKLEPHGITSLIDAKFGTKERVLLCRFKTMYQKLLVEFVLAVIYLINRLSSWVLELRCPMKVILL